jgi:hypothetical protein
VVQFPVTDDDGLPTIAEMQPVILCDDVVQHMDGFLSSLSKCFRGCKESFSNQARQICVLLSRIDLERGESARLRLQLEHREQAHGDLEASLSARLDAIGLEKEELLKSVSLLQCEAAFANESQKAAWTALQQMSITLKGAQNRHAASLEGISSLQDQLRAYSSKEARVDSMLGNVEAQVEKLLFISEAALRHLAEDFLVSNSRNAVMLESLKTENVRLQEQCWGMQSAFQTADAQHVLANIELRKMRQAVKAAEDRYAALKLLEARHEGMNSIITSRNLQLTQYLENIADNMDFHFEHLELSMTAIQTAFSSDYQLIRATAMDAVKVGRAMYKELCASQDEQALLNALAELTACRLHLVQAAKVIGGMGQKSTRVGGGYDYVTVAQEFLDLQRYVASSWWGKAQAAGLDPREASAAGHDPSSRLKRLQIAGESNVVPLQTAAPPQSTVGPAPGHGGRLGSLQSGPGERNSLCEAAGASTSAGDGAGIRLLLAGIEQRLKGLISRTSLQPC